MTEKDDDTDTTGPESQQGEDASRHGPLPVQSHEGHGLQSIIHFDNFSLERRRDRLDTDVKCSMTI